jgi:hypothetical protein
VLGDFSLIQADVCMIVDALENETHFLDGALFGNGECGLVAPEAVRHPFAEKGVLFVIEIRNKTCSEKIVINASGNTRVDCGSNAGQDHAGFHGCALQRSKRPSPCNFPVVFQKNSHN